MLLISEARAHMLAKFWGTSIFIFPPAG